eukprot:2869188-Lingulodinium_polyedra.AAC.1
MAPVEESPEEACRAFLGLGRAYDGSDAPHMAQYERDLLSIPHCGAEPVPVTELLAAGGRELL